MKVKRPRRLLGGQERIIRQPGLWHTADGRFSVGRRRQVYLEGERLPQVGETTHYEPPRARLWRVVGRSEADQALLKLHGIDRNEWATRREALRALATLLAVEGLR